MNRRALWVTGGLLVGAVAGLGWWWNETPVERQTAVQTQPEHRSAEEALPRAAPARLPASTAVPAPAAAPAKPQPLDPAGSALDLKRVFDEYSATREARGRRMAARAFNACIPAFLPVDAQTPSPEPLIRALPKEQRAEREASYWSLFARCRGFTGDSRAALEGTQRELRADPQAEEPGWRAQEDLLAGRTDRIDALVSQGLSASDPAAIAAMSGVAAKLAQARNAEALGEDRSSLARAVDAALPMVACDLGLDCGADSLAALQLCAAEGLCDGDLAARIAQRNGGGIDAARVQEQRARLLALIRSGRPLTAADLLP